MQPIRLQVAGRTLTVDTARVVSIGRSPDADVPLSGATCSRVHAELRPTDTGWVLVDVGSQHGTYVDGRRVFELGIQQPLTAYFGLAGSGGHVGIVPAPVQEPPRPVSPPVSPVSPVPPTPSPVHAARPGNPGPAAVDPGRAVTMAVAAIPRDAHRQASGPDVLVWVDGSEHRFHHPTLITIGRHPDCTVVCSDPVVSRYHGRLDPTPGGWSYTNASNAGTYIEGRKMTSVKIEDGQTLRLGHPTAGVEVNVTEVVPPHVAEQRIARRHRQKMLRRWLGAAAVLAVIVGGVVVGTTLVGDDTVAPTAGPDELTSAELGRAKLATVWIRAQSTTTSGVDATWYGSGSIISPDGLILTNAHVAEPQAAGLAERYGPVELENPESLDIAMISSPNDETAEPVYRARVIESDGMLDASVIQIYETIDGEQLPAELELPTVPIGDSDQLRTGEEVTILGFPGIADSAGVSVTRGVISTIISDPALDSDRAEIDTDARIAEGNSGGLAINNAGEIIGIPSSIRMQEGSLVVSGRLRSINLVKPLIEDAR